MAAGDALVIPVKNRSGGFRLYFTILDADGDPVTGATGLDAEISKDGAAFADCSGTETEVAQGWYFVDLTQTEVNADAVLFVCKTSTSGAKQTNALLVTADKGFDDLLCPTTSGRTLDVDANGGAEVGSFQAGAITSAAFTAGAIDAAAIATDAIGSAELAASAVTEIAGGIWDEPLTAAAHNVASSAGLYLRANAGHQIGTAQAGAAGTITLAAAAVATDSYYVGAVVKILEGTGVGQSRLITAYVGSTKVATVANNWTTNPDNTSVYAVLPGRAFIPVGGLADSSITAAAIADAAIDAATFAAGAIDANAIATDAIGSAELAASAVTEIQTGLATSTALAAVQSDTDDIQTRLPAALVSGRMDASVGAMAANVVTASAIATDAIGAAELAADAVTEIQSGLATASAVSAIQADTDDIQTRLPAALVSGRMDASVGAMAANVVTASAIAADAIGASELAADAVTEIQSGLATSAALATVQADTDDIQSRLPAALTGGKMEANVGSVTAAAITAAAIAADAIGASELAADAVAEIAAAVGALALTEQNGDPGASPTMLAGLALLYMALHNEGVNDGDAGTVTIAKSDGTVILTATTDLTGNVFTRGKFA
jgi:hypothetical protein